MRNHFLTALLTGAQLAAAADCNANNCLRQVRASNFPTRLTVADCSSFFLKTVYPATVTATQTITITAATETATSTETNIFSSTETDIVTDVATATATEETTIVLRRQVTLSPSEIPAYASSCHDVDAYSSACSCIGVTGITTTFLTPTSTATLTVSVTASTSTATTTDRTIATTTTTTVATTSTYTSTSTTTTMRNCATQVVTNPGFDSSSSGWSANSGGSDITFYDDFCGVIDGEPGQDCDLGIKCGCLYVGSDSPGGTATLRQTLTGVCPGREYSFVAYIGLQSPFPGSAGTTTVTASLGGVNLFTPFLPCTAATPCTFPGGEGSYYKVGPIIITPQVENPVLAFDFLTNHPTSIDEQQLAIDDITLTLV